MPTTDSRPAFLKLYEALGTHFAEVNCTEAIAEACPYCGKERHFYLNTETGQFNCKRCGECGNAVTYLRHKYSEARDTTTDAQLRTIKQLRGIPLQTLKRYGICFYDDYCLIPAKSPTGEVVTLVRYRPPRGNLKPLRLNLPGLCLALHGLEYVSDDITRKLLMFEGAWDLLAADHHLRAKKVRERYDLLAVPGAGVFKEEWAKFCRSRLVRLAFDNDDAGRNGQLRVANIIRPVASEVYALQWPDGLPKGYDISDLLRDGGNLAEFLHEHCVMVGAGSSRLSFIRGDAIEDEPLEWLWEGRIQFGTFVSFSGLMGTQKSGVIRDLCGRATAGKPMPNCTKALAPFDVIYFTSEDGRAQVKDLVKLAGGDLTRLHIHDIDCGLEPIDLLNHLDELEAEINALKVRLVVIDALNSFVGGDISSDSKARRTLTGRLQALARRTGVCIVGIRNWGRADGGTSRQRTLGAVSLSDVSRCVLNTQEVEPLFDGGRPRFLLEFEKVSNANPSSYEPIPYEVEDLSTGSADSHLRRIVWGQPISAAQRAEIKAALQKG